MRNLKKHLEKIYRKVALKLVKQGAGPPPAASADASKEDNPGSQEALHISGVDPPLAGVGVWAIPMPNLGACMWGNWPKMLHADCKLVSVREVVFDWP